MAEEIREPESPPEETPLEEVEAEAEPEVELTEEEKEKQRLADEHAEKLGIKKPKNTFQARIGELTKSFREEERKNKALAEKIAKIEEDRKTDVEALRKHNEDLMGVVKSQLNPPPIGGKKPEQVLKELRAAKQMALSEVNYEKAFQIQDQIEDVILTITKPASKEDIERIADEKAEEKLQQKEMISAVDGFKARNKWFDEALADGSPNENYDPVMASAAIGMETQLAKTWKKSYPELIEHIEKEINKRFNPPGAPAKPKIPAVMGDGGGAGNAPIQLTDDQRRVALNLFPGDKDAEKKYAEQLKIMGRAK